MIEEARRIAAARSTTLNAEFRRWLADYVRRKRQAEKAMATIRELRDIYRTGGRKFTRDEMNER